MATDAELMAELASKAETSQQPQPSSRLLYLHVSPVRARPPQVAILAALHGCTRFKLHFSTDHTPETPHIDSVEFEDEAKAIKACALLRNTPLRGYPIVCTVTLSRYKDLALEPFLKTDGGLLNVTELPPTYTASDVYDLFLAHGPIYICHLPTNGVARLTYYSPYDAAAAERELNFLQVGVYQIIVRFTTKYDYKASFRTPLAYKGRSRSIGDSSVRCAKSSPTTEKGDAWRQTQHKPVKQSRTMTATFLPVEQEQFLHFPASSAASWLTAPQDNGLHITRLSDSTRLVVQNIPPDTSAAQLFHAFVRYGSISEALVAVEAPTAKRLNIGIVKFTNAKEAASAVQAIANENLPDWGSRIMTGSLRVKLYELKCAAESKIQPGQRYDHNKDDLPHGKAEKVAHAAPSAKVETRAASFGSSVTSPTINLSAGMNDSLSADLKDFSFDTAGLSAEQRKYERTLLVVLQDMGIKDAAAITNKLLQLPAEQRQCRLFDEGNLNQKFRNIGIERADTVPICSPTRSISRSTIVPLLTPAQLSSSVLVGNVHDISRPSFDGAGDQISTVVKECTVKQLVQMSAKALIELASGKDPPRALAHRDERRVGATDEFLDSIQGLRPSQHLRKQRIGEKIFKLLKTRASDARSLSARTIRLLDEEDLRSLAHLSEEFPEILVAKAVALDV